MQFEDIIDIDLKEVWKMIVKKINEEVEEVCPNSSIFYKTKDGIECSLRREKGDLTGICFLEND